MKSCEMHLVLVLSDHVNVGKDIISPPRPKKPKREEPHKQLYIHMLRHQENSPVKILGAKGASLRFQRNIFRKIIFTSLYRQEGYKRYLQKKF